APARAVSCASLRGDGGHGGPARGQLAQLRRVRPPPTGTECALLSGAGAPAAAGYLSPPQRSRRLAGGAVGRRPVPPLPPARRRLAPAPVPPPGPAVGAGLAGLERRHGVAGVTHRRRAAE